MSTSFTECHRGVSISSRLGTIAFALASLGAVCAGGLNAPEPVGAFFNGVFPQGEPGSVTGWTTENAFPNLTFVDPLVLREIPGTSELLVVGKSGLIYRFENDPTTVQAEVETVLDWTAQTETSGDQGFYSLVFHPEFGQAGSANAAYVYVCYNHRPVPGVNNDANTYWRVSRFTWLEASGTLDPASEFVLINQYDPQQWHNGGAMFFDDVEGYLHITCGDGGGSNDAYNNAQKIDQGFFSGMFRIDVDYAPGSTRSHAIRRQPTEDPGWNKPTGVNWPPSSSQGYGIPNDNPWVNPDGSVLEEFYAIGLRSPHSAHYDAMTGDIWVGDVGQGTREELTRLPMGSNAQWAFKEGFVDGPEAQPAQLLGIEEAPLHDYGRTTGTCIIGGMRYRGTMWNAELGGKVLFGDHVRGRIWTATIDENGGAPTIDEIISGFPTGLKAGLANFCTDSSGEVYLMTVNGTDNDGGTIRRLVSEGTSYEPPSLLSETGVFTDLLTLQTAPGVIPYEVANPLWSDAAEKRRWIILPNDGSHDSPAEDIVFSELGNWVFPAGTVIVKHFEIRPDERNPGLIRRLETRFLICTENGGKYGVTYKWNPAGTDAELLTIGDVDDFTYTSLNGDTEIRQWDYPARADCMLCHTDAAGQALGLRTHSLNSSFYYEASGREANQLETFNDLGMFDRVLSVEELQSFIEARPLDDETAPVEHRVRSYLESNCSHCHMPGSTVEFFDLRLGTPLNEQGVVNGAIQGRYPFDPEGRYLKPGDVDLSALHFRANSAGNGDAMPPLAKNLIDAQAVAFLEDYIESLDPLEFETSPSPQARYVRLTALSEVNGNEWTSVGEFAVLDGSGVAIPTSELSVVDFDSQELVNENSPASNVVDGVADTIWHTEYGASNPSHPHFVTIDLGSTRAVGGYVYTPRQNSPNGRIADYRVEYGVDGSNWALMDSGRWSNGAAEQTYAGLVGTRKARCEIAGPVATVPGPFEVTVVFDMDVDDFESADIQVSGGEVTGLRGKGYYYVATISPDSPQVSVSVPADVVNGGGLGSRPSEVLSLDFIDTLPPMPVFTGVPAQVNGPFQIGLTFGEQVVGLELEDFVITNATLDAIVPDGSSFRLSLTPLAEGTVGIILSDHAVVDLAGIPMDEGVSVALNFTSQVLARNAGEFSYLGGGMELVTDPSAPHGEYLWLPEDAYPGNYVLPVKTQHRAEYEFVVPVTGDWLLRGLIQSPNNAGDSFWIELDGNQAGGDVYLWDTSPVGAGYVWDFMNNRNGANPVVLNLSSGPHTITVFGRDDGTRLDRLELESVRPRVTLLGPPDVVNGLFTVAVEFSESVSGLEVEDFTISGGSALSLTGAGSSYLLEVSPSAGSVVVSLPENLAFDDGGSGNFVSNPVHATYRSAYEQWAFESGVDGSVASQLADDDQDGIVQLLEFAFNLDPTVSDASIHAPGTSPAVGLPRMVMGAGPLLSLQYLRRKGVSGLTYEAQFGGTLENFTPAGAPTLIEQLDTEWERVTVPDPAGSGPVRRFGRVEVTLTPTP